MFQKWKNFLTQPYPDEEDLKTLIKTGFAAGFCVFFILFALRPFGLHQLPASSAFSYCLKFGLLTVSFAIAYESFLKYVLKIRKDQEHWTLFKWILHVLILLFLIAIGNYFLMIYLDLIDSKRTSFLSILLTTLIVGIFPITLFGSINVMRKIKYNEAIASQIDTSKTGLKPQSQKVQLQGNGKKKTVFDIQHILYIEAMQNYINVVYDLDGQIYKQTLRNTIKEVSVVLKDTPIQQCHRSYLVNQNKIDRVSGNAQGLQLYLTALEDQHIPVSRKFIPFFK